MIEEDGPSGMRGLLGFRVTEGMVLVQKRVCSDRVLSTGTGEAKFNFKG